jgi:hypothetical protein
MSQVSATKENTTPKQTAEMFAEILIALLDSKHTNSSNE